MPKETKQSIGGQKRAESLTSDQRSKIASMAAQARWKEESKLPKAEFRGEVIIGDIKIPCAVLDNGKRVISETGITKAILGTRSGASIKLKSEANKDGSLLPIFLAPPRLKDIVNSELGCEPIEQIIYKDGNRKVVGYGAEILPIVCDIWLKAREAGLLQKQQLPKAMKAEILMRGLARVGVIALVDEATGYQAIRDRQALQKILESFIAKELQPWVKTFPDEFYEQLFRLRGWEYKPLNTSRPGVVAHYTVNLIYERLAPGVLDELKKKAPKSSDGRIKTRLHQGLTADIGHPKLREHISNVLVLLRVNDNWDTFMKMMDRALPKYCDGKQFRLFTKPTGVSDGIIEG
jgi:hypothetical protein